MKKLMNVLLMVFTVILLVSCESNPMSVEENVEIEQSYSRSETVNVDRIDPYLFDINSITQSTEVKQLIKGRWFLGSSCISSHPNDYSCYETGQIMEFTENMMINDVDTLEYYVTDDMIYFVTDNYVVNEMKISYISQNCFLLKRFSDISVQYNLSKNNTLLNQ